MIIHGRSFWIIDLTLELNAYGTSRVISSKEGVRDKPIFLIANAYQFSAKCIVTLYLKRFTIEVFFKDAKLAQDFFSPMYHPLTPKAKEILRIIAKKATRREFSFKEAVEWTGSEGPSVSPYIAELVRKGVVNKLERGRYQIFHSLFLEYLKTVPE